MLGKSLFSTNVAQDQQNYLHCSLLTHHVGAHFKALNEPILSVLMTPSDSMYTQVIFNLVSVQVCSVKDPYAKTPDSEKQFAKPSTWQRISLH